MMQITIRRIDREHEQDIRLKNEPFALFGRLIPRYDGKSWSHAEALSAERTQMCFPDENYDFDAMEKEHIFLGAYAGERCVGLAVLRRSWNRYLYVYDLKVNADHRGKGVGSRLMDEAEKIGAQLGYRGLWLVAQDDNLAACRFYLGQGFCIGGMDTHVYRGTRQEGKADVHFYRENRAAT